MADDEEVDLERPDVDTLQPQLEPPEMHDRERDDSNDDPDVDETGRGSEAGPWALLPQSRRGNMPLRHLF
ncbi:hypothetical protein [Dongia deserti]|uniref:hypothetical protein n=1 Tax=Dongia deserti TaxID=2268030 RepID=UPI0013C43BE3|nr:hypothetical protein [Dongia deserti]